MTHSHLSKAPRSLNFSEEKANLKHSLEEGSQVQAESRPGIFSFTLFQKVSL